MINVDSHQESLTAMKWWNNNAMVCNCVDLDACLKILSNTLETQEKLILVHNTGVLTILKYSNKSLAKSWTSNPCYEQHNSGKTESLLTCNFRRVFTTTITQGSPQWSNHNIPHGMTSCRSRHRLPKIMGHKTRLTLDEQANEADHHQIKSTTTIQCTNLGDDSIKSVAKTLINFLILLRTLSRTPSTITNS